MSFERQLIAAYRGNQCIQRQLSDRWQITPSNGWRPRRVSAKAVNECEVTKARHFGQMAAPRCTTLASCARCSPAVQVEASTAQRANPCQSHRISAIVHRATEARDPVRGMQPHRRDSAPAHAPPQIPTRARARRPTVRHPHSPVGPVTRHRTRPLSRMTPAISGPTAMPSAADRPAVSATSMPTSPSGENGGGMPPPIDVLGWLEILLEIQLASPAPRHQAPRVAHPIRRDAR